MGGNSKAQGGVALDGGITWVWLQVRVAVVVAGA